MSRIDCGDLEHKEWQLQRVYLPGNDVHVWSITISSSKYLMADCDTILNVAEQDRANKYHQPKDRERFIVSRVALRMLLGKYLGKAPAAVLFAKGQNHKPYLVNGELQYNVSHSADMVVIAIAKKVVGVDIEFTASDLEIADIISDCFNEEEQGYINCSTQKRLTFYKLWTRKEAILKAIAKGIDADIMHIPCLDRVHEVAQEYFASDYQLKVRSVELTNNYMLSVAFDAVIDNVVLMEW